jgi:signal peptidase II
MKDESKNRAISIKYIILLVVTILIIGMDQWTKSLVLQHFRLGETWPIFSNFFNLTYVQNKGAAFGLLSQADPAFRIPFFIIVPVVALSSIAFVFRKISEKDIKLATALSLVISGAIGNLIDRLTLGFVVDFLDFHWKWGYHFPAFNVADSAICIGVGLIMLDMMSNADPSAAQQKGSLTHASRSS